MRDYGKVHTAIWASPTFKALSDDGRMLAMYLLTCSHQTIAGVCRLPDGYVSEDLDWAPARVRKGFDELFRNGFATRCEATKWVQVHKFLEWNPPENPNQRKAVDKCLSLLPKEVSWLNPCETLSEPFLNQEQEQEQEITPPAPQRGEPAEPAGFIEFWASWPKSPRKGGKVKCLAIWRKCKLEAESDLIVSHVKAMALMPDWRQQSGKFIPAPETYLNGRRWDGAEIGAAQAAATPWQGAV